MCYFEAGVCAGCGSALCYFLCWHFFGAGSAVVYIVLAVAVQVVLLL